MKKFLVSLFLICAAPAFALLSPLHQSINEYYALLECQEVVQQFPQGETIESIERAGDQFTIRTGSKQVIVDVIYSETSHVGPRQFELVIRQ